MSFVPLCGHNDWVEQALDRVEKLYVGSHGVLVTTLDSNAQIIDEEPLIADFGDVLPFMNRFGRGAFVKAQIEAARPFLSSGLYQSNGRIRLFSNHDWLLGLLELFRATEEQPFLDKAADGARTLIGSFFVGGLLIDENVSWRHPKSWLCAASPFNGGYIELWNELHGETGDRIFLESAKALAAGWIGTPGFRQHGIFARTLCAYSRLLDRALRPAARMKARLFKDNTNLVWGLLDLYAATGDDRWRAAIEKWLSGFEAHFFNDGMVFLWLDNKLCGQDATLRAAFSTIDLLCDLAAGGIVADRALGLAERIAHRWVETQWENGLFPENSGCEFDHLDSNVDMAIALMKLAGMTGQEKYAVAARRAAQGVITHHQRQNGFVLAVTKEGGVSDGRIIVKYQALLLKLAIAPDDPQALICDRDLLYFLRDR